MYSINSLTTSAIPPNCESGRSLGRSHLKACVTWLWCTWLSLCFFFWLGGGGWAARVQYYNIEKVKLKVKKSRRTNCCRTQKIIGSRKVMWWGKTKRRDRLAKFWTLEDRNMEQPFKPIRSAGKGDNTRPLWVHGRVLGRNGEHNKHTVPRPKPCCLRIKDSQLIDWRWYHYGLVLWPHIGYNYGIFVCSHYFIYCC